MPEIAEKPAEPTGISPDDPDPDRAAVREVRDPATAPERRQALLDAIHRRHEGRLRALACSWSRGRPGADPDDLLSVGRLALQCAIIDPDGWSPDGGAALTTWVWAPASWRMADELASARRFRRSRDSNGKDHSAGVMVERYDPGLARDFDGLDPAVEGVETIPDDPPAPGSGVGDLTGVLGPIQRPRAPRSRRPGTRPGESRPGGVLDLVIARESLERHQLQAEGRRTRRDRPARPEVERCPWLARPDGGAALARRWARERDAGRHCGGDPADVSCRSPETPEGPAGGNPAGPSGGSSLAM